MKEENPIPASAQELPEVKEEMEPQEDQEMMDNPEDDENRISRILKKYPKLNGITDGYHCHDWRLANHVSNCLEEALELCTQGDEQVKKAAAIIMDIMELVRKHDFKLSYSDCCVLLKIQINAGDFYRPVCNLAGGRGSGKLLDYVRRHPRNIDLMFAAIFSGYSELLPPLHEQYYYLLAKKTRKPHVYFKENSLRLAGTLVPYHAVYAAICRELPASRYTRTGATEDRDLQPGMQGFPRVWALYNWDEFTMDYPHLFRKFRQREGRELVPADLIIATLTHRNRYHGLRLIDRSECPILNTWIENLPENQQQAIKDFEETKWTPIEDDADDLFDFS